MYFDFFFSSRRRHTRFSRDWSSDVCSSDLDLKRILAIKVHLNVVGVDLHVARDHLNEFLLQAGKVLRRDAGAALIDKDELKAVFRSEERRVGKRCSCRAARGAWKKVTECTAT